jgi:hypothetical protein
MKCGAMDNTGLVPRKCPETALENGRCATHGGLAARGAAHKGYKGGRYSRALPDRLLERYEEALADPELLSLREEISIIQTRTEEVMSKLDTGESGAIWKKLQKAALNYKAAEKALNRRNLSEDAEMEWKSKRDNALEDMIDAIEDGATDYAAWREVLDLFQQRKSIGEAEQKRLIAMQQMITAESAVTMQVRILNIIKNHVTDPAQLSAIASDFAGLSMARIGTGT